MDSTARAVLERLPELPAGPEALAVAERCAGVWLVGGAVRDALLGRAPRDLDLLVDGEVDAVTAALGGSVSAHERFGTAEVVLDGGRHVNVARARSERYPVPGALPEVAPADAETDLRRRDFTVNALAVGLSEAVRGELRAAPAALEDLRGGRLRVLHERSFLDDPTRLLRLVRYAVRLGFEVEPGTAGLARAAVWEGALATVSEDRVGAEVRLLLAEDDPLAGALAAAEWRVWPLDPPGPELTRRALDLLGPEDRPDLLVLAAGATGDLGGRLRELGFTGPDADRAAAAARAPALAPALARAQKPSEIAAAVRGRPPEAVALAGALGAHEAAARWLGELRHVRLAIGGRELLAAGIPEGPEVGRRLARALDRRLDGELAPGPDAELAAALEE